MKDLFEVESKITMTVRTEKLPKGVTEPIGKLVEMALPLAKRLLEAWVEQEEKGDK